MKDFCKNIFTGNISYSEARAKFHRDLETIYRKIGKRVITETDMITELRKMGWTDQELAKAHITNIPVQKITYIDGTEIYK
jgi:hypothetical protein